MRLKNMSKPMILAAATGVVLAGVAGYKNMQDDHPGIMEIYVFALKNSEAIFIRTPDDKRILINGGSTAEVVRFVTKILPFYSRRIDIVVATAPIAKKTLGLIEIVNRYDVSRVYVPGITLEALEISSTTDKVYETFLNAVQRKSIPLYPVKAHNKIRLGSSTSAEVLFPVTADMFEYSKASSPEAVIRIMDSGKSMIILGDVSKKVQKYLARDDMEPADILVVPHDASSKHLDGELLEAVKPKYLVYSQALSRQKTVLLGVSETMEIADDRKFNVKEGIIKITPMDIGVTVEILK